MNEYIAAMKGVQTVEKAKSKATKGGNSLDKNEAAQLREMLIKDKNKNAE